MTSSSVPQTPFRRIVADFVSNPVAIFGLRAPRSILFLALFAPLISPRRPLRSRQLDVMDSRLPPGSSSPSGGTFWLGTDDQAATCRRRFSTACGSASASARLDGAGACHRAHDGTHRRVRRRARRETLIMRCRHPAVVPRDPDRVDPDRRPRSGHRQGHRRARDGPVGTSRGRCAVLRSSRSAEYIEAAHCLALSPSRIVFRHLLPNRLPPMIVVATVQVAARSAGSDVVVPRAGVPITEPSLGLLIANGYQYLLSGKYWISFTSGIALLCTIVASIVADQLRDAEIQAAAMSVGAVIGAVNAAARRSRACARLRAGGRGEAVDDVSFVVRKGEVMGSWASRFGQVDDRVLDHGSSIRRVASSRTIPLNGHDLRCFRPRICATARRRSR